MSLHRFRAACAVLLVVAGMVLAVTPAKANDTNDECNDIPADAPTLAVLFCMVWEWFFDLGDAPVRTASGVTEPAVTTQRFSNLAATMQPGEPTEGGRMTRSIWVGFRPRAAERVVIHTYGSEIDTVMTAYRGTALDNLTRIASNDNTAVQGLGGLNNKHSLLQLDTVANADYRLQLGSRNEAEGDIFVNVFRFPAEGGLSAFLLHVDGNTANPFNAQDYICDSATTSTCPTARFVVHNSTAQTLRVVGSSDLGPGVTPPAPFDLAPGALKAVTFRFGPAFDRTTPRAGTGHFAFTGRAGGIAVARARHPALIRVRRNPAIAGLIRTEVTPAIVTARLNEPRTFRAKIVNAGTETAIGCHFAGKIDSRLKTRFRRINPTTGNPIGAENVPSDIAAGQSMTFEVTIASQQPRIGTPLDPEAVADCINHSGAASPLRSAFDLAVWSYNKPPPEIEIVNSTPANGILKVPSSGFAHYRLRVVNRGMTSPLSVLPAYIKPFDDPPDSNFAVQICRTNPATGACLAPYAGSVDYRAKKDEAATFSVRVAAPATNPPFDQDQRRVVVNFRMRDAPFLRVGLPSVAVRKQ